MDKIPNNAADTLVAAPEPPISVEEVAGILGVTDQLPPNPKIEQPHPKRGWQVRGPETLPFPSPGDLADLTREKAFETAKAGVESLDRQMGRFLPAKPVVHYHIIVVERPRRSFTGKLTTSALLGVASCLDSIADGLQRLAGKLTPPAPTISRR